MADWQNVIEFANSPLVFLCYAQEDKKKVDEVYLVLRQAGLSPWMDKPPKPHHLDGIEPGAEWEQAIRKKIGEADFFIAFLSNVSVSKRGFVQKEFRLALKVANEVPPDRHYFLPALLEPCRPPDMGVDAVRLHERQWYPLYEYGLDGLISHIRSTWHGGRRSASGAEHALLRIDESFRPHFFYGGQGHHLGLGLQLSYMITNQSSTTLTLVPPEIEVEDPQPRSDFSVLESRYWIWTSNAGAWQGADCLGQSGVLFEGRYSPEEGRSS